MEKINKNNWVGIIASIFALLLMGSIMSAVAGCAPSDDGGDSADEGTSGESGESDGPGMEETGETGTGRPAMDETSGGSGEPPVMFDLGSIPDAAGGLDDTGEPECENPNVEICYDDAQNEAQCFGYDDQWLDNALEICTNYLPCDCQHEQHNVFACEALASCAELEATDPIACHRERLALADCYVKASMD